MLSLCRLCAKCKAESELNILTSEIHSKMSVVFRWESSENEIYMPPKVCNFCVEELNRTFEFVQNTSAGQEVLLKLISEIKQNESNQFEIKELRLELVKLEPSVYIDDDDISNQEMVTSCIDTPPISASDKESFDDSDHNDDRMEEVDHQMEKVTKRVQITSDPFLFPLSGENCLSDGTINADGVAKLEKIFPKMENISWSTCQFKCNRCEKTFDGVNKYFAHNHGIHLEDVRSMEFVCFYCDFKTRRDFRLHQHIYQSHFVHLKYRCFHCPEYFWNEGKLNEHRKQHTNVEYKCETCGKISLNSTSFYTHILRNHRNKESIHQETNLTCDICSKNFKNKKNIRAHMRTHSNKYDVMCDLCGWKFLTRSNLNTHMKTTHSTRRDFACENCSSKFKTKNQLLLHAMTHSNVKAYKCTDCDKAFNTPNSLRSHKKCHDNILSYECKFCGRKFRFPSTLKDHERLHTRNIQVNIKNTRAT